MLKFEGIVTVYRSKSYFDIFIVYLHLVFSIYLNFRKLLIKGRKTGCDDYEIFTQSFILAITDIIYCSSYENLIETSAYRKIRSIL